MRNWINIVAESNVNYEYHSTSASIASLISNGLMASEYDDEQIAEHLRKSENWLIWFSDDEQDDFGENELRWVEGMIHQPSSYISDRGSFYYSDGPFAIHPSFLEIRVNDEWVALQSNLTEAKKPKIVYDIATFPRVTIKAGTTLYHGTNAKKSFTKSRGPTWFAHSMRTAQDWIGWQTASIPADKLGGTRVLSYKVAADVELLNLDALPNDKTGESWARWCEMLTGKYDELGPGIVASEMNRALIGWWANDEVMLLEPNRWLDFITQDSLPQSKDYGK